MKALIATLYPASPLHMLRQFNPTLFLYGYFKDRQTQFIAYITRIQRETSPNTGAVRDLERHFYQEDTGEYTGLVKEEATSDRVGSGYSPKGDGPQKKKQSRLKKALVGGAVGGVASFAIAASLAVPTFLINQINDILTGKIGEVSVSHSRRYRRKNVARVRDLFSKQGRLGSQMINQMEKRGYRFIFSDSADPNRITGIVRPDGETARIGAGIEEEIGVFVDDYMQKNNVLRKSRWKTKRMNAFYGRFGVERRSLVTPDANDLDTPQKTINRNLAEAVDTDDFDINARSELPDDITDEERAAEVDANNELTSSKGAFKDLESYVKQGGNLDQYPDQELVKAYRQASVGAGADILSIAEKTAKSGSLGGKVFGGLKSFFGATDIADKTCTINRRLKAAALAARTYAALSLMKYSFAYISASDGVRKGEAQSDLLGELMKRATSPDFTGNYIGASSGFAFALNGGFSSSTNDAKKSAYAVDGKLTGVWKDLEGSTDIKGCNIWQNPFAQGGIAAGEVALTVVTGGLFKTGTTVSKEAVKQAVKASIKKVFTRGFARSLAVGVAIEISFEGVMALAQIYVDRSLSTQFLGQENGAQLGDILTAGAGVAATQRGLQAGQVPASPEGYAQAHSRFLAEKEDERNEQSFFARMFDMENTDSLAFSISSRVALSTANVGHAASNMSRGVLSAPSTFLSSLTRLGSGVAGAQDDDTIPFDTLTTEGDNSGIDLATDHAGNLLTIMTDEIADIDPVENRDFLQQGGYIDAQDQPIGDFRKHVNNCVENLDIVSRIEGSDLSKPENDCLGNLDLTKRFKAHLAYIDMIDGAEAQFDPESISSPQPQSVSAGVFTGTEITNENKGNDTSGLECAQGSTSERVVAVGDGSVELKLCSYGAVRDVNASWSGAVSQMLEAAEAEGITFGGGGFRTAADQIRLRKSHCGTTQYDIFEKPSSQCKPPTARPGRSNHELGLAIDFTQNGSTLRKSDSGFTWLQTNAGTFGIKNLPSESWHWSWNGS